MACLEQLQEDVASILAIMQLGNSCCDDQDITDGDRYTDRVTDGEGDVPQNIIDAGYADDAADWGGFDDYKCMIVHVVVNNIEQKLREISDKLDEHGVIYGGVVALAGVLGVIFATGGIAIIFGLITGVSVLSTLYNALIGFGLLEDLADDVAANHDELACAMYYSDGDEAALVALNDKIDELFSAPEALILKNLGSGPTLKALYAGRYDLQDIAAELDAAGYELDDFDCSCAGFTGEYQYFEDFEGDVGYWQGIGGGSEHLGGVGYSGSSGIRIRYDTGHMKMSMNRLRQAAGLGAAGAGDYVTLYSITFWYKTQLGQAVEPRMTNNLDGDNLTTDFGTSSDVWKQEVHVFDPGTIASYPLDNVIYFRGLGSSGGYVYIDEIMVDYDVFVA